MPIDEIKVLAFENVTAPDLGYQEKIALSDARGEFLNGAGKRTHDIDSDMLYRIDPKSVAVRQANPILMAESQIRESKTGVVVELA